MCAEVQVTCVYSVSCCLMMVEHTSQSRAFGGEFWVCSRLQQGADQPELLRSSLAADHTLPPPLVERSCCEEIQVEVDTPGLLSTLLSIPLFLCTSFATEFFDIYVVFTSHQI